MIHPDLEAVGWGSLSGQNRYDLAAQLRQRYPDGEYERTLHSERNRQAEQRRADAMNEPIETLLDAFVKEAAL
jgi:hypothetical protein